MARQSNWRLISRELPQAHVFAKKRLEGARHADRVVLYLDGDRASSELAAWRA
jgi:hypothetical protein